MCGWWWTCGCLECAAFCKLFPSNTIHIPQLNCLWILGLWGKLECNWMCHASKYPIETALSVTSFCLHDPFPHFQLTIKCFHTHTHSGQPCPPFKIIILDEADSMTNTAQVSKTKHSVEKRKQHSHFVCVAGCLASYNGEGIENNSFLPHLQLHQQVRPNPSALSWWFSLHSEHMPQTHFLNSRDEDTPLIRTLFLSTVNSLVCKSA